MSHDVLCYRLVRPIDFHQCVSVRACVPFSVSNSLSHQAVLAQFSHLVTIPFLLRVNACRSCLCAHIHLSTFMCVFKVFFVRRSVLRWRHRNIWNLYQPSRKENIGYNVSDYGVTDRIGSNVVIGWNKQWFDEVNNDVKDEDAKKCGKKHDDNDAVVQRTGIRRWKVDFVVQWRGFCSPDVGINRIAQIPSKSCVCDEVRMNSDSTAHTQMFDANTRNNEQNRKQRKKCCVFAREIIRMGSMRIRRWREEDDNDDIDGGNNEDDDNGSGGGGGGDRKRIQCRCWFVFECRCWFGRIIYLVMGMAGDVWFRD